MTNLPERIFAHDGDQRVEYIRVDLAEHASNETGNPGNPLPNDPNNVPDNENIQQARFSLEWLKFNQRQLDIDGVEVAVSRQALTEVLIALEIAVDAPAPSIHAGYRLVPEEPTEEMKVAAFGPIMAGGRGGPITADFVRQTAGITTYKAMVAADPSQPLVRGESE